MYYEAYLERDDALGRERYLTSGSGREFLKTQLRHYLSKRAAQLKARGEALRATRTCSINRGPGKEPAGLRSWQLAKAFGVASRRTRPFPRTFTTICI
jgi:hypothetical protein